MTCCHTKTRLSDVLISRPLLVCNRECAAARDHGAMELLCRAAHQDQRRARGRGSHHLGASHWRRADLQGPRLQLVSGLQLFTAPAVVAARAPPITCNAGPPSSSALEPAEVNVEGVCRISTDCWIQEHQLTFLCLQGKRRPRRQGADWHAGPVAKAEAGLGQIHAAMRRSPWPCPALPCRG